MWLGPNGNTPSIIQTAFGLNAPGEGEAYCGPTSMLMGLYWLIANGFTQLGAAWPADGNQNDKSVVNLERLLAGLFQTSIVEGTGSDLVEGFSAYLHACGISPKQYTQVTTSHPDLAWVTAQLAPNYAANPDSIVIANVSVGWYTADRKTMTMTNNGGHVLTPLQTVPAKDQLLINNSAPTSLFATEPNPQTVTFSRLPAGWTIEYLTSSSMPSNEFSEIVSQYTTLSGASRAILWGGNSWTISISALPTGSGYAVQPWIVDKPRALNTNGAVLTVIAPLQGSGGLVKHNIGVVQLTSTNSLSGETIVTGGVLSSSAATSQPFGTGSITLFGNGVLAAAPSGAATLASGAGGQLTVRAGGGTLSLGGTASFAVTIGGNTQGSTPNLHRLSGASLVIAVGGGLAALGSSQQVLIAGNSNRPPRYNGMILPWVVGQDTDSAGSGAFLTYDRTSGLVPATTVNSADTPIDQATDTTIYQVTDSQSVGSSGASVLALEMDGGTIDGTGTLQIGSQAAGGIAGLILNGGGISAPLQAGASEIAIYAADTGGSTISSTLGGSGGLVLFGPGPVSLAADSSATLSGAVHVNGGTVVAAGSGSATGSGVVTVHSDATLQVTGAVSGPINVEQSGLLYLDGGTVADVTMAAAGGVTSYQGGYLQGGGTIAGQAALYGVIQSGPAAGLLNVTGTASFSADTSFYWRLDSLVDDSNGQFGVDWNAMQFTNNPQSAGAYVPIYFDFTAIGGDPDQANSSFWSDQHSWTVWIPPTGGTLLTQLEGWVFGAGQFGRSNTFPCPLIWTPAPQQDRAALLQQKAAQRVRQRRPWHWRLRNVPRR